MDSNRLGSSPSTSRPRSSSTSSSTIPPMTSLFRFSVTRSTGQPKRPQSHGAGSQHPALRSSFPRSFIIHENSLFSLFTCSSPVSAVSLSPSRSSQHSTSRGPLMQCNARDHSNQGLCCSSNPVALIGDLCTAKLHQNCAVVIRLRPPSGTFVPLHRPHQVKN